MLKRVLGKIAKGLGYAIIAVIIFLTVAILIGMLLISLKYTVEWVTEVFGW